MNRSTIHQNQARPQATKEGGYMSKALTVLLRDLIRENAQKSVDGYNLHIDELTHSEKRLILSHLVSASEYEHICESYVNLEAELTESRKFIQKMIDDTCDEVYYEDVYELGGRVKRHADNNEIYFT